jgi:GABA(A) receptor-associated protein
MEFKKQYPLHERLNESKKILERFPNNVPVICEKDNRVQNCNIEKRKYLIHKDITVGQFMFIIRKQLETTNRNQSGFGLFLFTKGTIPSIVEEMGNVYKKYKDDDGYLYINYSFENTFG